MQVRDDDDPLTQELVRALDAFVATHGTTAATFLATKEEKTTTKLTSFQAQDDENDESDAETWFHRDLNRLQYLCTVLPPSPNAGSLVHLAHILLSWLQKEPALSFQSPFELVPSWLVATLLTRTFHLSPPLSRAAMSSAERATCDQIMALVVTRCFLMFQHSWHVENDAPRSSTSSGFFSYFSTRKATPVSRDSLPRRHPMHICTTKNAAQAWRHVLALAAQLSPDVSRLKLHNEIIAQAPAWNATKRDRKTRRQGSYLEHFTPLSLGLALTPSSSASISSRMAEAVRWLRVLMPLLLHPHRSHVRRACAHLLSRLLRRELDALSPLDLCFLYASSGTDWSRCISDLHAAALRLTDCAKKKRRKTTNHHELEASAWALRTVVLAVAPHELFSRYWRDDTKTLLQLQSRRQSHHQANATSFTLLPSLALSFRYLIDRHKDSQATPSTSECMEIINTLQAWIFFSLPRLRPQSLTSTPISTFQAFRTTAVPAFLELSRAMASFNLTYTIQSHVRRLLADSLQLGEPQKLIGVEIVVDLLENNDNKPQEELLQGIRDLVERVLLDSSLLLGHQLATELSHLQATRPDTAHWNDPTHGIAIATFAAALSLLPAFYTQLSLPPDQKLLLLVRATVHRSPLVRQRALDALRALLNPPSIESPGKIVHALIAYIKHLPTSEAVSAIVLLRVLQDVLDPLRAHLTQWESDSAQVDALTHVEAISLYLLVKGDDKLDVERILRLEALETLHVAHKARQIDSHKATRSSIWTLMTKLEPEFETAFASALVSVPNESSALQNLMLATCERSRFRWSVYLARLAQTVVQNAPDVPSILWLEMVQDVSKLEPVLSISSKRDVLTMDLPRELARWRDVAVFATVSASCMPENEPCRGRLTSLVRQLACHLRSSNVDQRQAAVLALGHVSLTALPTLLEALTRLEADAFPSECIMEGAARLETKTRPKLSKKTSFELEHVQTRHWTLQWAMGRCYRLVFDAWTSKMNDQAADRAQNSVAEALYRAGTAFLAKLMHFTLKNGVKVKEPSVLWRLQLDFLATLRSVLQLVPPETAFFVPYDKLAALLLQWCGAFDTKLTVSGSLDVLASVPASRFDSWRWVDELLEETSCLVAQYVLCHQVFGTLVELLRRSLEAASCDVGTWKTVHVFAWLDACFRLDSIMWPQFNALQAHAQRALHLLLEQSPAHLQVHDVVQECLEKATYSLASATPAPRQIAQHYVQAIAASPHVLTFFRSLLAAGDKEIAITLAVRLLHVLVLHSSDQLAVPRSRQATLDLVTSLLSQANETEEEMATTRWHLEAFDLGRAPVSVSALLATRFSRWSLRLSLAILSSIRADGVAKRDAPSSLRQLLTAVLPWLAEISLERRETEASNQSRELLDVLFDVTRMLGERCSDPLEHLWLTLALTRKEDDSEDNVGPIVSFLYRQQCKNNVPCLIATQILSWLCRWQDTAVPVLRGLVFEVSHVNWDHMSTLDALRALVFLASEPSAHLQALLTVSTDSVRVLALELIHTSLLTLFALRKHDDDVATLVVYHCHVLLHAVLPLLDAPRPLLVSIFAQIRAVSTKKKSEEEDEEEEEEFFHALQALSTCLTAEDIQLWSNVCLQAMVLPLSHRDMSCSLSVRFALLVYTHLCPPFQGDVVLAVLALLRQALNADTASSLANECLILLRKLLQTMPVSNLVLYPQVFWLALALLRPDRPDCGKKQSFELPALDLVAIVWQRASFSKQLTTPIHALIESSRPCEWTSPKPHHSILWELVRCLYASTDPLVRPRALELLQMAVLLVPRELLGVSKQHHVVICTLALLPVLLSPPSSSSSDGETNVKIKNDLLALWQSATSAAVHGNIVAMFEREEEEEEESEERVTKFMASFFPCVCALEKEETSNERAFAAMDVSVDVLLACLPQSGASGSWKNEKQEDVVFFMLEELMRQIVKDQQHETKKKKKKKEKERAWQGVVHVETAMTRVLRRPNTERQWQAAVRVLRWIAQARAT